jgi:S1-C subfamily serine protease
VNLFDLVVIALVVAAVVGGFRLGFVTRVLSWMGMLLGLVVGVLLLPALFARFDPVGSPRLVLLGAALVLLVAFMGQAVGFFIGDRLRPIDRDGTVTRIDRGSGAIAGLVGIVAAVWLLVPMLTHTPGWVAREVSTSWVAQQVDRRLPTPPDAMQALRSLVGEDNFPDVFADLVDTPELDPPPPAAGISEEQARQIARSVVRVEGIACRRVQNGSGFVAADGLVVTNAHVVAGQSSTDLVREDGSRVEARVVTFDPGKDLAVLHAPQLNRPPLAIGTSRRGQQGGVFGHPGGRPLRIAPFAVAREIDAVGRDIYGQALSERSVLEVAAALEPGDSGGALVDGSSEVVGVTFAISRDQPGVAYALATGEVRQVLDRPRAGPADTGPCLS